MNKDKYVFAQLLEFLDYDKFRHLVDKYDDNKYVKHLTCWNQLLALMLQRISLYLKCLLRMLTISTPPLAFAVTLTLGADVVA